METAPRESWREVREADSLSSVHFLSIQKGKKRGVVCVTEDVCWGKEMMRGDSRTEERGGRETGERRAASATARSRRWREYFHTKGGGGVWMRRQSSQRWSLRLGHERLPLLDQDSAFANHISKNSRTRVERGRETERDRERDRERRDRDRDREREKEEHQRVSEWVSEWVSHLFREINFNLFLSDESIDSKASASDTFCPERVKEDKFCFANSDLDSRLEMRGRVVFWAERGMLMEENDLWLKGRDLWLEGCHLFGELRRCEVRERRLEGGGPEREPCASDQKFVALWGVGMRTGVVHRATSFDATLAIGRETRVMQSVGTGDEWWRGERRETERRAVRDGEGGAGEAGGERWRGGRTFWWAWSSIRSNSWKVSEAFSSHSCRQ
jgi:hypothetical protein